MSFKDLLDAKSVMQGDRTQSTRNHVERGEEGIVGS